MPRGWGPRLTVALGSRILRQLSHVVNPPVTLPSGIPLTRVGGGDSRVDSGPGAGEIKRERDVFRSSFRDNLGIGGPARARSAASTRDPCAVSERDDGSRGAPARVAVSAMRDGPRAACRGVTATGRAAACPALLPRLRRDVPRAAAGCARRRAGRRHRGAGGGGRAAAGRLALAALAGLGAADHRVGVSGRGAGRLGRLCWPWGDACRSSGAGSATRSTAGAASSRRSAACTSSPRSSDPDADLGPVLARTDAPPSVRGGRRRRAPPGGAGRRGRSG